MANMTGHEPVRPLHSEHIHVAKKQMPWLWLLLGLVVLGLLAWMFLPKPVEQAAVTTTTTTTTTAAVAPRLITYDGHQWEVKSENLTFAGGEVKLLGKSAEGDALYVNAKSGYMEGEGAESVKNTISTPSGRVYLKNGDGRFQPLFQKP